MGCKLVVTVKCVCQHCDDNGYLLNTDCAYLEIKPRSVYNGYDIGATCKHLVAPIKSCCSYKARQAAEEKERDGRWN